MAAGPKGFSDTIFSEAPIGDRITELTNDLMSNFWIVCDYVYNLSQPVANHPITNVLLGNIYYIIGVLVWFFILKQLHFILGLCSMPGPWYKLPFLGHYPFINGKSLHLTLPKLALKYGPTFEIKLGKVKMAVLADSDKVNEILKSYDVRPMGKPPLFVNSGLTNFYGFLMIDSIEWPSHRKFTMVALKNLTANIWTNGHALEEKVENELKIFLEDLNSITSTTGTIDPHYTIRKLCASMVSTVILGRRYKGETDERFTKQLDNIDMRQSVVETLDMINYFPILRFLPRFKSAYQKRLEQKKDYLSFLKEIIDEHHLHPEEATVESSDFIYAYFKEEQKQSRQSDPPNIFGDERLCHLIADLFGAGIQTMTSSLLWCLVFLIRNPDVVRKAQEEMDAKIGRERMPKLDDLERVIYMRAIVLECQRLGNVLPLGVPKALTDFTRLFPYYIEKDTLILNLLSTIHTDPKNWIYPDAFEPERFMDQADDIICPDHFMPYGAGQKTCPALAMARASLFLVLSTLLHRFNISLPEGDPTPGTAPDFGVTLDPGAFRINLEERDWGVAETTTIAQSSEETTPVQSTNHSPDQSPDSSTTQSPNQPTKHPSDSDQAVKSDLSSNPLPAQSLEETPIQSSTQSPVESLKASPVQQRSSKESSPEK